MDAIPCLSLTLLLATWIPVECVQVPGLPEASSIEELVLDYQDSLALEYRQERLFPDLRFPFDGRIVGWTFAAFDSFMGGGDPVFTLWSFHSDEDVHFRSESIDLTGCLMSTVVLDNGDTVSIRNSGPPAPGIKFNSGDIFGFFLRPDGITKTVPYLYDGMLQTDINPDQFGNFSYYRIIRAPRASHNLTNVEDLPFADDLLPLISLELCYTGSEPISGVLPCNGTTMEISSEECAALLPEVATMTTTGTPANLLADNLLVITIAIPVALFILLVITLVLLVCICCLFNRKRKHSTYTTDIAMESFHNRSEATPVSHHYSPASPTSPGQYDTIDPIFVISVTGETENKLKGKGPVANYEEPMAARQAITSFNGNGDIRSNMYDTPLHSREPSADQSGASPTFNNYTMPPVDLNNKNPVYHTLERPEPSNTPPIARSGSGNSPHSSPANSPKPRLRLRSNGAISLRKISQPNNNNIDSPASDNFFRLEAGSYVQTEDQRNHSTVNSLFDDTAYGTFNAPTCPVANNWAFFEESESYWKPSADSRKLYDQLSNQKYREIDRKQIEIMDHLGSGEFGTVCRGEWHTEQGDLGIAVKMLTGQTIERDRVRFLQEAAIIGQFKHPNIVRLHGVVTVGDPIMIVLELIANGDLRKYLRSLRPVPGELTPQNLPQKLLDFCSQISLGMEYLARKQFVHRDLAARNILLTEDYVCKIADFGMSRDLDDDDYYISNGGKIPIKWTAPEALHYRKYSSATDVWSFGVLMFEVWSLGKTPFKEHSPEQTISLVQSGYRLAPPPGCPRAIYRIIIQCWHAEADFRPTFAKLIQELSHPTSELLFWSPQDSSIHPQANSLGAPLEASEDLYSDLQNTYLYSSADLD